MSRAVLSGLALCLLGGVFPAGAEEALPSGPPWRTDYQTARREALRSGKPVFLYFTKSH